MNYKVLFISDISISPSTTLAERMLIKGLCAKGVDITVVTHRSTPETREIEDAGITVHYIPIKRKISRTVINKLRSILLEGSFDILHLTYGKAVTNAMIASRKIDIKIVAYFGSMSLHWHDPSAYLAFLHPRIDKLICLSDNVEKHVKRQLPRSRRNRTVRIYRGFDPRWLEDIKPVTRHSLGIPDNAFLIACVVNVRKVKGVPYLIKAAAMLPHDLPVWFLLVGKNTDSKAIKRLVAKTPFANRFILKGEVPVAPAYTALCDLYVQPSISEGLGRAILEAMSLRKTVIVTDRGGAKELFIHGKNGFVVPSKGTEKIADTILWCYNNSEQLSAIGDEAYKRIVNDFTPDITIDSTYSVYKELMS